MFGSKKFLQWIFGGFAICAALIAQANPALVYQYNTHSKIVGVRALVDIGEPITAPGDNCDQRIADIIVDNVIYDGASDMISGFRANQTASNEWSTVFGIDTKAVYDAVPDSARHDVQNLIKKGAHLIVTYQVCGSGGFIYVRDVYKKSALNNP